MEHARKYMLVSPEVARFTHQPDDLGGHISGLDRDMADILKAQLDPYVKWQEYKQALHRYLHYQGALRKPFHLEFPAVESETLPKEEQKQTTPPLKTEIESILDTLPSSRRKKASILIEKLRLAGVSFNEDGELVDRGKVVGGTSFHDLIHDSARKREGFFASGRRRFADIIKELNIPNDLVGNSDFLSPEAPVTRSQKKAPQSGYGWSIYK
jgi:hypothetical protein